MVRVRPFLVAAVGAFALLLSACIKLSDDATVKADGSGSFSTTTTIDLSAMKGIEAAFKGMGPASPGGADAGMDGAGDKPAAPKKEDPLEEMKKEWKGIEGLELTKATSEEKDGKINIAAEANFKTLEAYARASSTEMNASLKKNADGSYTLKFSSDEDAAPPADAAMGDGAGMDAPAMGEDPAAGMAAAFMPMLEPFMKDLEMKRKLTLPGTIVETNGTKGDDGSTVSWKITFADVKTGKLPAQTVTFKGEGLDLKPFSIKREHKMGGGGMPGGPEQVGGVRDERGTRVTRGGGGGGDGAGGGRGDAAAAPIARSLTGWERAWGSSLRQEGVR